MKGEATDQECDAISAKHAEHINRSFAEMTERHYVNALNWGFDLKRTEGFAFFAWHRNRWPNVDICGHPGCDYYSHDRNIWENYPEQR